MRKISYVVFVVVLVGLALAIYSWSNNKKNYNQEKTPEKSVSFLYPSINSKKYYEEIYSRYKVNPKNNAEAVIINHHLFAPDIIATTIESASNANTELVVIVSPDHFEAGKTNVTLCDRSWETPFGYFAADNSLVKQLVQNTDVRVDCDPFAKEHGITNVISFVKHAFPNANVLPLILKENTGTETIKDLSKKINSEKIVTVGSFDFTHNKDIETTRSLDNISLEILKKIDTSAFENITVDSKKGILLLMEVAKEKNYTSFSPQNMTSAAELVKRDSAEINTSYINGYFY